MLTAMRAQEGALSYPLALFLLCAGTITGDVALFVAGRLAQRLAWLRRMLPATRTDSARDWLSQRIGVAVLTSRFVPGLRVPTFISCGLLGVPFAAFAATAAVAATLWTFVLFMLATGFGDLLMHYLGAWHRAGTLGLVLCLVVAGKWATRSVEARARMQAVEGSRIK